jgi:hypothetical protein
LSQISLLPSEYRNYILKEKKKRIYVLTGVIVASAFTLISIMLMLINLIYVNQLNSLSVEEQQLETMIETYGKYSDVYNSLKKQEGLIEKANIDSYNWDEVLNIFSDTILQGMWLDSINMDYDEKKGICIIKGHANDISVIAQWLKDVENSKVLKDVNCNYLQDLNSSDLKSIEFEIYAEIDMSVIKSIRRME